MITVVGDLIVDEYYHAVLVGPHSETVDGRKLRVLSQELRLGGAAAVAALVAAHEERSLLASVTGDDAMGSWAVKELQRRGVRTEIHRDADRMTTVKTRVLLGHKMEPARLDCEMLDKISDAHITRIGNIHLGDEEGDALCLVDYDKGVLSAQLIRKLIARAKSKSLPVFVDPAVGVPWKRYAGATVIKANRVEALTEGVGLGGDLLDVAAKLSYRHKCRVVITDGAAGMFWAESAKQGMVPACPAKVVDITGCGDVVLAALAVCNRLPLAEACQQAAVRARDCVSRLGVC